MDSWQYQYLANVFSVFTNINTDFKQCRTRTKYNFRLIGERLGL